MQDLLQDLRFAFRSLRQSPGFALVAILTLALGIGANSAIFSVVNGVVLQPLPYEQPERLVFVTSAFPTMGFDQFWMSAPEYLELREWSQSLQEMGGYISQEVTITGREAPIRVMGTYATASFFETLGVPAARGRVFGAAEDGPAAEQTAVITWELWQNSFGGADDLIGGTLELNGEAATILGVLPPGFDLADSGTEVWMPLGLDPADPGGRASHFLNAVARLAPGVTENQARAELDAFLAQWGERIPEAHTPSPEGHPLQFEPLSDEVVGEVRQPLLLLLGAVGFVLLIACANVGNLLLARAEARQKEIAIRTALGAGRGRLLRQFLTESLALSLLGGATGLMLGTWWLRALLATSPESIPRVGEIGLDGSVVIFTVAVSLLTGLLFGFAPSVHLRARGLAAAVREGGERSTHSLARARFRQSLVVVEIALAVVLVIGAGLMLRSFASLQSVDPGFHSQGLLTFQVYLPRATYADPQSQIEFLDRLMPRLQAIAGVDTATLMSGLPPRRRIDANDTEFEGVERRDDGPPHNVDYYQHIGADYFETMGIGVTQGRAFAASDSGSTSLPVAIVNRQLANVFYPGEDPLGRRLRTCCGDENNPWLTIVGVADDVKQGGLEVDIGTELYFYVPQATARDGFVPREMNLVARTSVPPTSLAAQVREAVWEMDSQLPVANLQTMDSVLYRSVARPRFLTRLLGAFGLLALVLAAVGTYGVLSYTVAERTHEMGIRMALGAEPGRVLQLVLGQGTRLAVAGLVLGMAAAFALTRFMGSMLYGVGTLDAVTFVVVPVVLLAVSLLACLLPARRATRVDPMVALRS